MKYTRLEIYKGISNSKLKTILGFFILIPLIAVITGSIITKIFIPNSSTANYSQNEYEPIVVASNNTTRTYKIFFLQAGAFISKSNAEVLKNAIKNNDFDPVVIEDDSIFRVVIDISDNKDLITQKKDKLQELSYNCLVNEFDFSSIEESGNQEIEYINKFINNSVEIVKLQCKISNDIQKVDISNVEILKKYIIDLNNNYIELEKFNSFNIIKPFKSNFEKFTNQYIKGYEVKDLNLCKRTTGQQVVILSNLLKEVSQIIIK
ncbi:MAG: hypothetical protein K0R09_2207 [Clostridiales bacterium]|jgi:hypothetical protein|nr:hypothetical protein [Clostridiales bacterium]